MLLHAWLKVPEDITFYTEALRAWQDLFQCIMAHAASQLKKNRDLEINAEEETEKKRKHRKRSRDRKKKVAMYARAYILPRFFLF